MSKNNRVEKDIIVKEYIRNFKSDVITAIFKHPHSDNLEIRTTENGKFKCYICSCYSGHMLYPAIF